MAGPQAGSAGIASWHGPQIPHLGPMMMLLSLTDSKKASRP